MAVAQVISSFAIGKFLHSFNVARHQVIMIGSSLIIIQTISLGYLEYVHSVQTFVIISFVAQVLGGFGAGANSTASMAIMSSFHNEEKEKFIGWI